jgi:hypothetical protein
MFVFTFRPQSAGLDRRMKLANESLENVAKLK